MNIETIVENFKRSVGFRGQGDEIGFELVFVVKLFAVSRKRRIGENADGLLFEAASELVADWFDRFAHETPQLLPNWAREGIATKIAAITPGIAAHIEWFLSESRKDWFAPETYEIAGPNGQVIGTQHPMLTFTETLNAIDAMKRIDRPTGELKAFLVAQLRVGGLAFPRSQWTPQLEQVAA